MHNTSIVVIAFSLLESNHIETRIGQVQESQLESTPPPSEPLGSYVGCAIYLKTGDVWARTKSEVRSVIPPKFEKFGKPGTLRQAAWMGTSKVVLPSGAVRIQIIPN